MADDFLPPVVAILTSDIKLYVAGLAEAQARMDVFVEAQTVAMAKVDARMATMGRSAGGMGAGLQAEAAKGSQALTEMGVAAERLDAKVTVSSAGVARAMREVSNSAAVTGTKWNVEMAQMEASMAKMMANFEAQAVKAEASVKGIGDAMAGTAAKADAGFLSKLGLSGKAIAGVGIAAGVAAYETVKMAGDFESSTTRLVTSAGESQGALELVRKGILDMAGQVGFSAEAMSRAMYTIESGGQHGADGLIVLRAAAQGAKTENADLKVVADAVTSVLQDYHLKATDAAVVTSKLVAAVGAGKTTFQELTGSLHSILPIASSANISLSDITGALASMTVHGMSADQAAQNLADTVKHMLAPTQVQAKELGQLGMSAQDLAGKLSRQGLTGTLQELSQVILSHMGPSGKVLLDSFNQSRDAASAVKSMLASMPPAVQHLATEYHNGSITLAAYSKAMKALPSDQAQLAGQFRSLEDRARGFSDQLKSGQPAAQSYQDALRRVMGDATGLNVALMLTGENTDYVNSAVKTVAGTTTEAGGNVKGWAEIQSTFNQKLSEAKAGLGALAIAIGTELLPALKPLLGALGDTARWLAQHKVAAEILAIVIGVALVGAIGAATMAMINFTIATYANPVTWIIIGIVWAIAVIVAFAYAWYQVFTHWSTVEKYLSGAWKAFLDWGKSVWNDFAGFFKDLWTAIAGFFKDVWSSITGFLSDVWNSIASTATSAWNAVGNFLHGVWMSIVNATRPLWEPIVGIIKDIFSIIHSVITIVVGLIEIGLIAAWKGIVAAAKAIWSPIAEFFTWLWKVVSDAFKAAWDAVAGWLGDRWREIVNFARPIWNGIVEAVSGPLRETRDVIVRIWDEVTGFIGRAWDRIVDAVAHGVGGVLDWAGGLAGKIGDAIGDLGSLLWNAGISVIAGFLRGLQHKFDQVKNFVGGIAQWVSDHKGPLDKDATLLTPHGNAVMDGLLAGLKQGGGRVKGYLDGFTTAISGGSLGTMGVTATLPAVGGVSSGSNSTVVHVHVNVEGSVHSVASLRAAVQDAVLQHKFRNATNGLG